MNIKQLTEFHLEFLSLKGGCIGLYESIHVKMPHWWKSHVTAHFVLLCVGDRCIWTSSWNFGAYPMCVKSLFKYSGAGGIMIMFGLSLPLLLYFVFADSEGCGKTALMCRFISALAAHQCDKYQNPCAGLMYS